MNYILPIIQHIIRQVNNYNKEETREHSVIVKCRRLTGVAIFAIINI